MNGDQPASGTPPSGYLAYLPATWRSEPFAGRFLLAFEAVLSGTRAGAPGLEEAPPGLEETIGGLARFLDPATTEPEFLPWLAGWVALSLRADWDTDTKRRFIQQIVPLYRLRGTKEGLQLLLELYTNRPVEVDDGFEQPPHFFQVRLTLPEPDPAELYRKQQIARAIIDQEKPAHTFYALRVAVPTMRLVSRELAAREGVDRLRLGVNTLLGSTIPNL